MGYLLCIILLTLEHERRMNHGSVFMLLLVMKAMKLMEAGIVGLQDLVT